MKKERKNPVKFYRIEKCYESQCIKSMELERVKCRKRSPGFMKQYRQSGLFILIFSWLMESSVMAQTSQGAGLVPTGENLNAGAVVAEVD